MEIRGRQAQEGQYGPEPMEIDGGRSSNPS